MTEIPPPAADPDAHWGIRVPTFASRVLYLLRELKDEIDLDAFVLRSHGDWCSAFYIRPSPGPETAVGDLLRRHGLDVALLDFDLRFDHIVVLRWEGRGW